MSSETGSTGKLGFDDCIVPESSVSVYEALYRRRMAWEFRDQPVPRDALDRMLATAVWAPNHRLTEPWRFFIIEKGSAAAPECCKSRPRLCPGAQRQRAARRSHP